MLSVFLNYIIVCKIHYQRDWPDRSNAASEHRWKNLDVLTVFPLTICASSSCCLHWCWTWHSSNSVVYTEVLHVFSWVWCSTFRFKKYDSIVHLLCLLCYLVWQIWISSPTFSFLPGFSYWTQTIHRKWTYKW